ncbi:NADPH-dependent methylglyoxal reductase GRE2 [Nakaseomyces glabratus]|nr:NADPH-dependent methylglyoxal reductase GRE2 [Nakaseomyces glabratus]KTB14861.1 NADPH-dependent methylglyoxal reductase GRE2 [Nakaseomyces glabratus]KTB15777.1 NADPH-dependent methylglyoxal reductase GRE2 [Nakaseomyces glabratus]
MTAANNNTTVFVSGASGFIAQHIIRQLLDQNYKVIGSVRSTEKGDNLKNAIFKSANFNYEIVKDIADLNAFDPVFEKHGKDIKVVLHTASPLNFTTTEYEKDLLIPAVNGTKGILESIKKYAAQTVERVVVTSSFASHTSTVDMCNTKGKITEDSWNQDTWENCQTDAVRAYFGSKKFAEEAAWEFLNKNKDTVKFKLATVDPVYVFGPQNHIEPGKKVLNVSSEVINQLVHLKKDDPLPQVACGYIDVRDIAKAHILAFQKDELIGQRLLLHSGLFTVQTLLDAINEQFPELRGKIPSGEPGSNKPEDLLTPIDNTKTKKLLGFEFRDLKTIIQDTVSQILEAENASAKL